ncbi:MAG: sugar ABC transporter substrate-binding protein [Elusimicrobia bacterium]|nr:MAG: sugar ABC transporter substrate-binding protein [Elusimicrobiota bacterium]
MNPSLSSDARLRILLVIVSLALSVLIGLLVSRRGHGSAAAPSQAQRRPLIGLSFDTLKEERWQRDRDAIIARAKALGADTIDLAANSNDTQQIRDVESLITSRVSVLIVVPHNGAAMAKAVALAHAAHIPVIAYDRLIPDSDLDFYITFDAVKIGALQARYLIDHLPTPGRGRIVRLHGAKTDHNAHLLKQGQDEVLKPLIDRGDIVVSHEDWVDEWKPENAKRIVNAALSRVAIMAMATPIITGILAPNDGTALGSVQALLEEGQVGPAAAGKPKVVITGQDAELAACQRILAGTQTMTIYKPLSALAARAAEIAFAMASGQPVIANAEIDNGRRKVPAFYIDVIAVDETNLMATVVKDGFHSLEALRGTGSAPSQPPAAPAP